jgi:hypothetical protein
VYEGAPGATVAVDERVDRLELRVRNGGLCDGRKRIVVDEVAEVLEELLDVLGRRRNEHGRARIEAAPAYPVLNRAEWA